MIKAYFEKKCFCINDLAEAIHANKETFRNRLNTNEVRFTEIKLLYQKGILVREDIDNLLK